MRHGRNISKLLGSSPHDMTARCHPQLPGCQRCLQEEPQRHTKGGGRIATHLRLLSQNPRSETKELLSLFISPRLGLHGLFFSFKVKYCIGGGHRQLTNKVRVHVQLSGGATSLELGRLQVPAGRSNPWVFPRRLYTGTYSRGRWDGGNEIPHVSKQRC